MLSEVREYGSSDTLDSMKTTIEIPDALAVDAKEIARRDGATLRELVLAGLRTEIERRRLATPRVDFHFPTASGEGITPGLSPADVIERSYGLTP